MSLFSFSARTLSCSIAVAAVLCLSATASHAAWPVERGYKVINGVSHYYEVIGEGVPIVVVHGGPGLDHSYFLPQMKELAKNYRLIFYDQRGMGKTSADFDVKRMTMDDLVEDLDGIRQAFGLEKMNLMGHSWGGLVSMFYAIKYPGRLRSLILSNSTPASSALRDRSFGMMAQKTSRDDSLAESQIAQTDSFKKRDPSAMAKYFRLLFRGSFRDKRFADSLTLEFDSTYASKSAMVQQLYNDTRIQTYDIHRRLNAVTCPTLIIAGADDAAAPEANEQIHESIRGSQYVILPDCGHFPFIEAGEKFFPLVRNFLKTATE